MHLPPTFRRPLYGQSRGLRQRLGSFRRRALAVKRANDMGRERLATAIFPAPNLVT